MIKERYRNTIKAGKEYPKEVVSSNNNPLIANVANTRAKNQQTLLLEIKNLKNQSIRENLQQEKSEILDESDTNSNDINKLWEGLKTVSSIEYDGTV